MYFTILEATQFIPKLVIKKNAKAKHRGTWIPFKSEKVSLNRLHSRDRAAYGYLQNLSKASGLSKFKVEKISQS